MGEKMDLVIGGRFKLGRKIGSGSFGELYLGKPQIDKCFKFFYISFIGLFTCCCAYFCRCKCPNRRRSCCQAGKHLTTFNKHINLSTMQMQKKESF